MNPIIITAIAGAIALLVGLILGKFIFKANVDKQLAEAKIAEAKAKATEIVRSLEEGLVLKQLTPDGKRINLTVNFGLVAYRMIVGGSYWSGDSLQQLYRQILMDPITSAAERARAYGVQLPPAFDYWFSRCVTRNPNERFPSAGQAIQELANVFGIEVASRYWEPRTIRRESSRTVLSSKPWSQLAVRLRLGG